jgi:hypothetical protein
VVIVWAFTAVVAVTAAQRVVIGVRLLREPAGTKPAVLPEGSNTRRRPGSPPLSPKQPAA